MTTLPEPRQKPYAAPAGQLPPGWPQPLLEPLSGPVELYGERPRIKYVPDAYGRMVPMLADQAPAMPERTPPRDLSSGLDPRAQIIAATGVGAGVAGAGLGWGLGQVFTGLAGISSGTVFWALCLLLAWRMAKPSASVREGDTYITHNHASWWGKTSTSNN